MKLAFLFLYLMPGVLGTSWGPKPKGEMGQFGGSRGMWASIFKLRIGRKYIK